MEYQTLTPEQILGPLNEVEAKNAPRELYVHGDISILQKHMSVSIIGSRKPTELGIRRAQYYYCGLASERSVVFLSFFISIKYLNGAYSPASI